MTDPCDKKSRSQMKREVLVLQKLGERLVELSPDHIKKIDPPQNLREAVLHAQTIKKHGGLRRQMQYIGAIMRTVDLGPIEFFLQDMDRGQKHAALKFQQIEKWRDELMEGSDSLADAACKEFPACDRQRLHQLIRNAKKEREAQQSKTKAARALFQYLKELSGKSPASPLE